MYISSKSIEDKKFGATKLNKLLYFCDFIAYVELGKPITGAKYFRLGNGPAPKCMVPVRREMESEGIIELKKVQLHNGKVQERTVPLRPANTAIFTGEELTHVDKIIEQLWNLDADDVSELSHEEVGWKVMRDRENIPYELAFYSNAPLTSEETVRAREIAKQRRAA
jgi:uncharacterized phage-associated protein